MKPLVLLTLALALAGLTTPLEAKEKKKVDLADLALLEEETLETLMVPEHNEHLARIRLAGAKAAKSDAEDAVKEAKRQVDGKKADEKAAKSERDAARKNNDDDRVQRAEAWLAQVRVELQIVELFQEWKEDLEDAARKRIDLREAEVKLREAELARSQVELIVTSRQPGSEAYTLTRFQDEVRSRQREVSRHQSDLDRAIQSALESERAWARRARTGSGEAPK